jgi:galactose mutarotase-like enzyme
MLNMSIHHRLDITTDSPCVQIYTSYWLDAPRKEVHGGRTKRYGDCSGLAIEQQGHLAGINMPEWGVDQICKLVFILQSERDNSIYVRL